MHSKHVLTQGVVSTSHMILEFVDRGVSRTSAGRHRLEADHTNSDVYTIYFVLRVSGVCKEC